MDFVQESLAHYVCCSLQSHWGHLTFELSDATVMVWAFSSFLLSSLD